MGRRTSFFLALFIVIVVGLALVIGLMGGRSAGSTCRGGGASVGHQVVITGNKVKVPGDQIAGRLCDTLTITNDDTVSREIAFGLHEHHEPYNGVTERVLGKGQSFTVTMDALGSFRWHDHIHDEVQGYFTVSK